MSRFILQGGKAGAAAGFLLGILLFLFVSPLVQKAETLERGGFSRGAFSHGASDQRETSDHETGRGDFTPNRWQRPLLSLLGAVLLGLAYGILSGGAIGMAAKFKWISPGVFRSGWISGLGLGLSGFAIFYGIPAVGLPSSLPGLPGAEQSLSARQFWWVFTALSSSLGIFAFSPIFRFLKNRLPYPAAGAPLACAASGLIISIPFLAGTPPAHASLAPAVLSRNFFWTSLCVNAVFWLFLGMAMFWFAKGIPGPAESKPGRPC